MYSWNERLTKSSNKKPADFEGERFLESTRNIVDQFKDSTWTTNGSINQLKEGGKVGRRRRFSEIREVGDWTVVTL